ncbi:MAG: LysR family transcriptional regulator [Alphaproteobacteria bacterium]|nr:LysR family transcriptional regulator [Alphaproteobacteria bacterium]
MTQPKLSIRQVEIVDAVARHRSVSRAATELHVSQSALSHALGVIENGLGVKLFTRAQSGVEPTAFVQPFIARARALRSVIEAPQYPMWLSNRRVMGHSRFSRCNHTKSGISG